MLHVLIRSLHFFALNFADKTTEIQFPFVLYATKGDHSSGAARAGCVVCAACVLLIPKQHGLLKVEAAADDAACF